MVYITDRRFNPRPDPSFTVTVYSKADSVELKLNGGSLGGQRSRTHLFQWPVMLGAGVNVVEAIGSRGSDRYSDQVTWTLGG